ncbi:hypothetical protein [Aestuariivita boseongensis]|uniref:hypothetical protein n=1 Tax=Aestuariivita boseongensis TaxID=1470562 RepID=UPI0006819E8C|nr:hypothetical protein [Aestuariivita boseongensis]
MLKGRGCRCDLGIGLVSPQQIAQTLQLQHIRLSEFAAWRFGDQVFGQGFGIHARSLGCDLSAAMTALRLACWQWPIDPARGGPYLPRTGNKGARRLQATAMVKPLTDPDVFRNACVGRQCEPRPRLPRDSVKA